MYNDDPELGAPAVTRRGLLAAWAGAAAVAARPVRAQPPVRTATPVRVAVQDFVPQAQDDAAIAHGMTQVIAEDLRGSGLVHLVDTSSLTEPTSDHRGAPQFPRWRAAGVEALVTGRVARQPDGRVQSDFRLWDVAAGAHLAAQQFTAPAAGWRDVAHMMAEAICERLTGEQRQFR
jgi:TolB protein